MPASSINTAAQLRRVWLDFFKQKQHAIRPSASLLAKGDPSLLFTTAGMVPFKGYFSGHSQAPWKRAASIQKCLRTTDLDCVGKTDRHCSFFEMLGNFSFGDYFKKEAIQLAWEFSTEYLKFAPEKIHVTVFSDDHEAEEIWLREIGLAPGRIKRLGKRDNWWGPAGEQGPCGPCSELYFDRGEDLCQNCHCTEKAKCSPGSEGERFTEYWNIVFNEFYANAKGQLEPLAQKGIDTGAGLERILALLNAKGSIYETPELYAIIQAIENISEELSLDHKRVTYHSKTKIAFRVLCDHVRTVVFGLADGIPPGNVGRGYVIRRMIRRASLYARELNVYQPILHRLVGTVVQTYGEAYPELGHRREDMEKTLLVEEKRFLETLELGLKKWRELSSQEHTKRTQIFSGRDAFLLYDSYGFPLELTLELASQARLKVNMDEYEAEMEAQRKRSTKKVQWASMALPALQLAPSEFIGYESTQTKANILAIVKEEEKVSYCEAGCFALIILNRTPFYPEGGGQVGDTGEIITDASHKAIFRVDDTQRSGDLIVHIGYLQSGTLQVGGKVLANLDVGRRQSLQCYHSATHLLNHSLRKNLGEHIVQTGSLVAPDHLRFDFSHPAKIPTELLDKISLEVNTAIAQKAEVLVRILSMEAARKEGAVATFGEKYGEKVRVVNMGKKAEFSLELCGGCHVKNTKDIRYFHIIKQSSPGSGNRRVEALVGEQVIQYFQSELEELEQGIKLHEEKGLAFSKHPKQWQKLQMEGSLPRISELQEPQSVLSLAEKITGYKQQLQSKSKARRKLETDLASPRNEDFIQQVEESLAQAKSIASLKIVSAETTFEKMEQLYRFSDKVKETTKGLVVLLGARNSKGALLLFSADETALSHGLNMVDLIREVAKLIHGKGGGHPQIAQAGGKDAKKLSAALSMAYTKINHQLQDWIDKTKANPSEGR